VNVSVMSFLRSTIGPPLHLDFHERLGTNIYKVQTQPLALHTCAHSVVDPRF
jgi:hypothetical protein